jgi:integrase
MKTKPIAPESEPIVVRQGSVAVKIYTTTNRIYRVNPANGQRELKSEHPQFTLTYYAGTRRVKRKFVDLAEARREADRAVTNLANGDTESLKLTGLDRASYVNAMQKLREWRTDVDLGSAVADYVGAVKRLPEAVSLKECVNFYLSRHPAGLPVKTVKEVVDELLAAKSNIGRADVYIKDIRSRLGHFARDFAVPISTVTGAQLQEWLDNLGRAGRTRNNYRRHLTSLFNFAMRRGYLAKDHSEMQAVEKSDDGHGEIEVFTTDELQKLFAACRPEMIPYLSIAAFCGLRAAEIQRLDWSEIHLTGPERFVEVKASKAKTASRRTVPISDNCAAWLASHAQASGPVSAFQRSDKQLFLHLSEKAGVPWKHNGLRHSFISYRLAIIKNVHQVSLEAGNSAQMVFAHYRQLVRESEANAWFAIAPAPKAGEAEIVAMPAAVAAVA